jgi:RimJ/RimL family protein N-acetyltransferase
VARALMDAAVEHARAAGQGLLTLWVRQDNARARRFYEKYGLRADGAERSGPHAILPIEIHEIRYRMSLELPKSYHFGSTGNLDPSPDA